MPLPASSLTTLAPGLSTRRLLNGLWQVSGAHGPIDPQRAIPTMLDLHRAGFTTWDLADHYGPAEDFVGAFRRALAQHDGPQALDEMQAFTKWVPRPGPMPRSTVEAAIDLSRQRMDTPALDLLQFHWWDYNDNRYLDALRHMVDLQAEGKIRHLGLTNFDTERMQQIHAAGVRIVSNQVQYSIIDQRPAVQMAALCERIGAQLMTYGTLCGGLLSERYLNQPEPAGSALNTASLRKYRNMIDAWGGWVLFQELLHALHQIARKHSVSIANVAVRYVLEQPSVAGVIVGVRLGVSEHSHENARALAFALDDEDYTAIEQVTQRSRDLFRLIGDCGDEYRR